MKDTERKTTLPAALFAVVSWKFPEPLPLSSLALLRALGRCTHPLLVYDLVEERPCCAHFVFEKGIVGFNTFPGGALPPDFVENPRYSSFLLDEIILTALGCTD